MYDKNTKIITIIGLLGILFFIWYVCRDKNSGDKVWEPYKNSSSKSKLLGLLINHQVLLKTYCYATLNNLQNSSAVLERLKIVGDKGGSLLYIDKELGKRA